MSNKSKWIKAIGVAATVIGVGVNLITDWVNEQKMDEKIEEKVSEALARRDKIGRARVGKSVDLGGRRRRQMESPTERAIYTVRYAIATMPVVQRGYNFEQASYMRWAGREVLIRLCKHPEIPPLIVIESFRDECDSYSCVNPRTSYVFSCAKDMLEWIIDLLIS